MFSEIPNRALAHTRMGMKMTCRSPDRFGVVLVVLLAVCSVSDCYDPLDPNGNITVTFDTRKWTDDGYEATVSIQNYYQYRHVDSPGWRLGWTWADAEVIWSMSGAFATQLGSCSPAFKFRLPHSCRKDPVIRDLPPDAKPEDRTPGCCSGGMLSAFAIDSVRSVSSFKLVVGNLDQNATGEPPANLTLMAPGPGYTCSPLLLVDPTVSSAFDGQREEQVFRTWKSTCTYSTFLAYKTPTCCVSFSTFYSPAITQCPTCSCGCRAADQSAVTCIRQGYESDSSALASVTDAVRCTNHMCPVRVHWHIKNNYVNHWRVKLTVSNYHYSRNYSNWNVLVQHPGLSQSTATFSFNSAPLRPTGFSDDVVLFWGLDFYNKDLLQADENQFGSVTSEILIKKDSNAFTLHNGWGFPRRVYFEGENCIMPLPDTFPMLPSSRRSRSSRLTLTPWLLHFMHLVLLTWPSLRP